jgi:hypothetical protein
MDERKSFEHWFSDEGKYPKAVERNLDGGYRIAQAASAWTAWQARAAIGGSESPSPPEAPKPDTLEAKAMEILSEMDTFGRKVLSGKVSDENIGGMAPLIIDTWAERLRAALAVSRSPAPRPMKLTARIEGSEVGPELFVFRDGNEEEVALYDCHMRKEDAEEIAYRINHFEGSDKTHEGDK